MFELGESTGLRLLDLELPDDYAAEFPGPAFGADGTRAMTEVFGRGTDILKALALGAKACMIGRPFLWGPAAAGEAGVEHAIAILRAELDEAMALAGLRTLGDVTADYVRPRVR